VFSGKTPKLESLEEVKVLTSELYSGKELGMNKYLVFTPCGKRS
jgi:hypothetical protein